MAFDHRTSALIEINELGQDVLVESDSGDEVREVPVPLRLGSHFVHTRGVSRLRVRRLRDGDAPATVQVRLHCDAASNALLWSWLAHSHALSLPLQGGVGSLERERIPALIDPLAQANPEPRTAAWRAHLHAMALLVSGQTEAASTQFLRAAGEWTALGHPEHARAALVGAVEDFNRAGASARVIELVPDTRPTASEDTYFAARLHRARCLALQYQGQWKASQSCYRAVLDRLALLQEPIEFASTAGSLAAALRERGEIGEARRLVQSALALATGPQSEVARAEAHQILAGLASDEGKVLDVLAHLREAQRLVAAAGDLRLQTTLLQRLGNTLALLGLHGDARIAGETALGLLDESDAPGLYALGTGLLGRIHLEDGNSSLGLMHMEAALEKLQRLGMQRAHDIFQLDRIRLLLLADQKDAARQLLPTLPDIDPINDVRTQLLSAEVLLEVGDFAAAAAARGKLDPDRLGLAEHTRLRRLDARLLWQAGRRTEALEDLVIAARGISAAAHQVETPLLQHMLRASIRPLRQLAVEMLAAEQAESGDNARTLQVLDVWMAMTAASADSAGRLADSGSAKALDQQIGRWILGLSPPLSQPAGYSRLLDALDPAPAAHAGASSDAYPASALAALRQGGPSLVILPGDTLALMVWIDDQHTRVVTLSDWPAIATSMARLDLLAQRADSKVQEIAAEADALSTALFRQLADLPRPSRLRILATEGAQRATWSLLRWPGDPWALGERIPLSIVQLHQGIDAHEPGSEGLTVLQATQQPQAANTSPFPPLQAAEAEARLLRGLFADRPFNVLGSVQRSAVIDALAQPGARVHLSAHGSPSPGLLLGSGLWLDGPAEDGQPEFLSALDLMSRGVRVELLVLNACQLAGTSDFAARASIDFATAVAQAGAMNVIAATRPVSDTASLLWVPAFYGALHQGNQDPAKALLAARQRLASSRAFRHPFHWSGWVHIERVALTSD